MKSRLASEPLPDDSQTAAITPRAAVYMASVLEYMVAEVLELAGNEALQSGTSNLHVRHILAAIDNDAELKSVSGAFATSGWGGW